MKNIAYVRVSSIDQNIARQQEAIEEHIKIDKWFIDKLSILWFFLVGFHCFECYLKFRQPSNTA